MEEVVSTINIESLPDDILGDIFKYFIHYRKGWTSVWYVMKPWFGIMITCKKFLRVGRKVFDMGAYRNRALRMACEKGYVNFVAYLLTHPKVNPADDNEPLKVATTFNHIDIVRLLLQDPRVNPAAQNSIVACTAITNNFHDLIQIFIADPRINIEPVFQTACKSGNINLIHQLIQSHPIVKSEQIWTKGFLRICESNKADLLDEIFVERSLKEGFSLACRWGSVDVVKKLINIYKPELENYIHAAFTVFPILIEQLPRETVLEGKILRKISRLGEHKFPSIQWLLQNYPEIDISAKNYKAILACIKASNTKSAFELLSFVKKPIPEPTGRILLCMACSKPYMGTNVIQLLLKKCVDVDPAMAVYDAVSQHHTGALDAILRDKRTKISQDTIQTLKLGSPSAWTYFSQRYELSLQNK